MESGEEERIRAERAAPVQSMPSKREGWSERVVR